MGCCGLGRSSRPFFAAPASFARRFDVASSPMASTRYRAKRGSSSSFAKTAASLSYPFAASFCAFAMRASVEPSSVPSPARASTAADELLEVAPPRVELAGLRQRVLRLGLQVAPLQVARQVEVDLGDLRLAAWPRPSRAGRCPWPTRTASDRARRSTSRRRTRPDSRMRRMGGLQGREQPTRP